MPEANVLYSVTAAVVLGLVGWVAVVLKSAKEPWARHVPPPPPEDDVPVEPASKAAAAEPAADDEPAAAKTKPAAADDEPEPKPDSKP